MPDERVSAMLYRTAILADEMVHKLDSETLLLVSAHYEKCLEISAREKHLYPYSVYIEVVKELYLRSGDRSCVYPLIEVLKPWISPDFYKGSALEDSWKKTSHQKSVFNNILRLLVFLSNQEETWKQECIFFVDTYESYAMMDSETFHEIVLLLPEKKDYLELIYARSCEAGISDVLDKKFDKYESTTI